MDATHSAAYILGASKLYLIGKKSLWLGVETLKQSETGSVLLRGAGNWNVHVGDNGYSQLNQIIGTGVGYGADLQSVWLKIISTISNLSLKISSERVQHDPNNFQYKWVDMIWKVEPIWKSQHLTITSSFNYIRSKNYLWKENRDISNWQTRLSFFYDF
jgi:hypothetical protein